MRKRILALAVIAPALLMGAIAIGVVSPSQAADPEKCEANGSCSVGQRLSLTIVEPGVQPTAVVPTQAAEPATRVPRGRESGVSRGSGSGSASATKVAGTKLSETGPRETVLVGLAGFVVLQLGLILTVRSVRATPRRIPARAATAS